jgi:beta-phosphoglucomutase
MGKEIKAFIFDLDGVITDTAEHHFLAWQALAEDVGITFTKDHNEELKGVSRMDSLDKILQIGGKEKDFSPEEKEKLAHKKNEHYLKLIQSISPTDILPGIEPLLARIKEEGLKLALASASKNAYTVMKSLQLLDMFDVIVDSNTIKNGKPNPEIFLRAAELVDIKPTHCIGVEDAKAGVDAIKAAGMYAVAVGPRSSFPNADIVYESTGDLSFDEISEMFTTKK